MRRNSPRCGRVCCIRLVVTVRSGNCSIACVSRSQTSARPERPVMGAISGSSITSKKKSPPNATGNPGAPTPWGRLCVGAPAGGARRSQPLPAAQSRWQKVTYIKNNHSMNGRQRIPFLLRILILNPQTHDYVRTFPTVTGCYL